MSSAGPGGETNCTGGPSVRRRWCAVSHAGRGPRPTPVAARRAGGAPCRRRSDRDVVRPSRGLELVEQPQSLLGERQRGFGARTRRRWRVGQVPPSPRQNSTRKDSRPRKAPAFCRHTTGSLGAASIPCAPAKAENDSWASRRASGAPKQWCPAQPNARWRLSGRRMSSRSGCGNRSGIAVGRGHDGDDRLALADRLAAELAVRRGRAGRCAGSGSRSGGAPRPPTGSSAGSCPQELPLIVVSQQRQHPVADQVRRRFEAADHRDDRVGDDLFLGEPVAVDLGGRERVQQAVPRSRRIRGSPAGSRPSCRRRSSAPSSARTGLCWKFPSSSANERVQRVSCGQSSVGSPSISHETIAGSGTREVGDDVHGCAGPAPHRAGVRRCRRCDRGAPRRATA